MDRSRKNWLTTCAFIVVASTPLAVTQADPLPGQVLKFQQLPLDGTVITDTTGTSGTYHGHDEYSTAYLNAASQTYIGGYMADDFADLASTPVVHIKWWGSYLVPPTAHVQKFLIAFESDVPAVPPQGGVPGTPSHPDISVQPLLSQIVTFGALAPGSGTFTETLQTAVPGGEDLYRYNAELAVPFNEQSDTVYWLKIVALDDSGVVPGLFTWGWHNRDYTQFDALASNAVPFPGGEYDQSTGGPVVPIWHYQDDSVRGDIVITPSIVPGQYIINQNNYYPTSYLDGLDGPTGIGAYSEDLAFELYTVPIPEPASLMLLVSAGLLMLNRRDRVR
ncbi:MAG: hypothetical protein IT444_00390 [Phycisphaeraceae bacterium]|nr:hypothetical protein [Phycisphaeraceae bacterium]